MLPGHAHGQPALLGQGSVAGHKMRGFAAHQPVCLLGQHRPQRIAVPGRTGHEALQLVVAAKAQARRHRLHALARSGT